MTMEHSIHNQSQAAASSLGGFGLSLKNLTDSGGLSTEPSSSNGVNPTKETGKVGGFGISKKTKDRNEVLIGNNPRDEFAR